MNALRTYTLLILVFLTAGPSRAQVLASDSLALVDLFNSTSGAAWTNSTGWLSSDVGNWFGISISGSRVTSVSLINNGLDGTVPASISDLSKLDTLDLSKNNLSSLADLSGLTTLKRLAIASNGLPSFPPLSGLGDLEEVDLSGNNLTICPDLDGLERLRTLDLSSNNLVEIPSLYDLLRLEVLNLSFNDLSWMPSLASNTRLTELDIEQNSLTKLPDLSANDSLDDLNARRNQLRDIPDLSGTGGMTNLRLEANLLDIDDLLAAQLQANPSGLFVYSPQNTILGAPQYAAAPLVTISSYIISVEAQTSATAFYEWQVDGTVLTPPTLGDSSLELGVAGAALAVPGEYICRVSDPALPGLSIPYAPAILSDASGCTTILPGVNDTLMSTAPVIFDGTDFCLEADWVFTNPAFAFDITIRNCTIWVCKPDIGIDALDGISLTLENVVLQPCEADSTWRGIDIKDMADVLVDSCTIRNATIGVDVSTFMLTEIANSDFINCRTGVRLFGASAFGSTAVDEVHNNSFTIDDGVPDFGDLTFVGVDVRSRNLGTFGFSSGVYENTFLNLNGIPCLDYCGIIAENAGIVIEDNNYVDMYCGVDLKSPQSANVVLNDTVLNLNVAECTAVSHLISNSDQPAKFSGNTLITAPSPYDSIFIGIGAVSNTNWVEIDNNELQNFDHSFVSDDNFRIRIFDNLAQNSYVGAYFRNTRQAQFRCNDIDDILCGSGYRVDNDLLEFVEMAAPTWFATRLDFSSNVLTHPPFDNNNNPDPDHDDEYSMRFFGCPAANPSVACAFGESVEVLVDAPDVVDNEMDSLRIEFTADLPPDPFGIPSGTCSPGPLREGSLASRDYAQNWLDWAHSTPSGTGDFRLDILQALEADAETEIALKVYPNPASDYFLIPDAPGGMLEVYDASARLRIAVELTAQQQLIPVRGLEPGIYHLRMAGRSGKLVIQR